MQLRVGAATDIGRMRAHNEDAYASDQAQGLFVVCDGMGGEQAGEVASQMAIDTIMASLKSAPTSTPDGDGYLSEVPVEDGDYLLLCSDGLTRMVADDILGEIVSDVRDPHMICETLIEVANRNGGVDNVTVVVIEVVGGWWRELVNGVQRS